MQGCISGPARWRRAGCLKGWCRLLRLQPAGAAPHAAPHRAALHALLLPRPTALLRLLRPLCLLWCRVKEAMVDSANERIADLKQAAADAQVRGGWAGQARACTHHSASCCCAQHAEGGMAAMPAGRSASACAAARSTLPLLAPAVQAAAAEARLVAEEAEEELRALRDGTADKQDSLR